MVSHSFPNLPPSPATLPYQVSELLALLHQRVDAEFGAVRVEGEVGSLVQARSGHRYFSLKDLDGQIRCAWFRSSIRGQPLSEGQKIVAHGRLAIYTPRGDLQLIVNAVEDAGDGALAAAFQRLKNKLQAEGLFKAESKKPLPQPVQHIIIVSSPQAAALQDVLVTLRRRDPFMPVELHPVPVQGPGAAEKIAETLLRIRPGAPNTAVLLTRGGGSLEDLQAFNTEVVARAVAGCALPVVSAIGHEVDFSISDFVASLRAATPTAAAELLSVDRSQQAQRLSPLRQRLGNALARNLDRKTLEISRLAQRLDRQAPRRRIETNVQRLDSAVRRLSLSTDRMLTTQRAQLRQLQARLGRASPASGLESARVRHAGLRQRLESVMNRRLAEQKQALLHATSRLESVSPRGVLQRGYAIVRQQHQLLTRRSELPPEPTELEIEWVDGTQTGTFTRL